MATIEQSSIELRNLTFHAHHGVLPEERLLGNTFTIDITLDTDISHAVATDELNGTINYAEVYEVIKKEMEKPSQLLEHICGRICTALLHHYPSLQRVVARVEKQNPPINGAGGEPRDYQKEDKTVNRLPVPPDVAGSGRGSEPFC